MKNDKGIVLLNKEGKILRYLNTSEEQISVCINNETKRLHLISKSQYTKLDKNKFTLVKSAKASSILSRQIKISDDLVLKALKANTVIKSEVEPKKDDEDKLPLFLKYSAIGHIAALFLIVTISWTINYFVKPNEPVIVQVFQQNPKSKPVVNVSQQPIQKKKIRKARVSNKNRVAKSNTRTKKRSNQNKRQAAQNINKMGALGVLGGFSKDMNGSGGLNVKAAKNNAGSGYGGKAARGGHSRALVGKGLVASGTGSSGSVKGYGGYGTSGKGGGKPGYGNHKLGGSSNGSLYALSDEALIQGGLDMDQINAVILRNRGQLSQCYERALQQNSKLSGSVFVKFVIAGSGKVSTAQVKQSSLNARSIETCLISKLRSWNFPKPVGSVSVRVDYPFVFKRNG